MSERRWTASQQRAIDYKGKNLILSAAAGSGKTATLTERIIRLLKDTESGAELSRMLIVTFTTAAAGELKSRIADALNEAIAKDPKNTALSRQLAALEGARISTIDSFFKSEIRPYFSSLGLPPDFSVLDEAEAEILRLEAMTDTVEGLFDGRYADAVSPKSLYKLSDCLSNARNESDLRDTLMKVSQSLLSYDIGKEKLLEISRELSKNGDDFFKTEFSAPLRDHLKEVSAHFAERFSAYARRLSENENTQSYAEGAAATAEWVQGLFDLSEKSYGEARNYISSFELPRLSALKKDRQTDDYIRYKDLRTDLSSEIRSLIKDCFSADNETIAHAARETAEITSALAAVNEIYIESYAALKREKGCVDFADLGIFARRLFACPDGTPTEAALEVSKKFDYVFIDEYQDTNPVQDAVFSAVSHYSGRFMVGDVKQSIYGFRGSCPELFTLYRKRYSETDEGDAVFMSENFRSDRCVIDFSNTVSRYIFSSSKTPFEKEDELVCSKDGGDTDVKCEVILCEKENAEGEPLPSEAEYTARRISALLSGERLSSGEPIRPKDIAILLRSGTAADDYVRALAAYGIPANNSATEEFFAYGEVLLVLCLLNTADNPLRDIYLAGSMKSPVFGFTLNDLINIRKTTDTPLWYSLCAYCEEGGDPVLIEKCRGFKSTVDRWRAAARELYCDEVLRLILSDTALRSYKGDGTRTNGDVIRTVKIISDHAAKVAKQGGTLHDLIRHLNSVMEKKDKPKAFSDPDSVTILTVHRSKGLEFPVCFLCESAKRFNESDTREKLVMDREGRIAMKLYDGAGLVRCDTPLRACVGLGIKEASSEEEARVLYVAMTRARERLIVTCRLADSEKRLREGSEKAEFSVTPYEILSSHSYCDWIIDALQRDGRGESFIYKKADALTGARFDKDSSEGEKNAALSAFFEKSLDFSYDKEYLENIPAKLTVSVLKPDILASEEEGSYFDAPRTVYMPETATPPAFLSGKSAADAARRGTATHVFMQFCDYENLRAKGAENELARLIEKRFISEEDARLVRLSEIELFIKSAIFSRILESPSVMRERRFNTSLPAADFTENASLREKLLRDGIRITVQGVVDCIFTDKDSRCVLLDYKTDRLTREELADESLAEKKLLSRHSRQLLLYREICERMLGRRIDEVYIYSLPLGRTVTVS